MNIASSEGVLNLYFIPNLCNTLFLNFNVVPSFPDELLLQGSLNTIRKKYNYW